MKDSVWYADAGPIGASQFHTLSEVKPEDEWLDKAAWDELRFGWVCTSADNFAEWKAATLKFCKETGMCSFEVQKKVTELSDRAVAHSARAIKKGMR